jgi:lactate permease
LGVWHQVYDPLHSWALSALVSALPLATLFYVLLVLKKRVWVAALCGMAVGSILALLIFRMPPLVTGVSVLLGVLIGWLRLAWIIVASIFLYNIAVATGQFQVMRETIVWLSADKRIQVILVAFCFGAFLEGAGGGGAPVALTGALLVGLGFAPLQAAKICLISNTVPLAWGGIGNPLHVLAEASGLPEQALSAMTGRIVPVLSAILPLWLVAAMVGWRRAREVLPAAVVGGLAFASVQALASNLGRSATVDIAAAAFSLLAMIVLLHIWRPAAVLTGETGMPPGVVPAAECPHAASSGTRRYTPRGVLKGWSSLLLASAFISILGIPRVADFLSLEFLRQPVPFLNGSVIRVPPVAPGPAADPAVADLNVVAVHGTAVFLAATLSGLLLGLPLGRMFRIFGQTIARLLHSLLGVSFMVGFLFLYRYSGMITVMGIALTKTGAAFPFFGVFVGWLGVALTGADSASSSLFGFLQRSTAEQGGLSPILMAAANTSGGIMGRMMDPQSILVSSTATQQGGREGEIFRTVFKHSLMLTALLGMVILLYAFVFPGLIPR